MRHKWFVSLVCLTSLIWAQDKYQVVVEDVPMPPMPEGSTLPPQVVPEQKAVAPTPATTNATPDATAVPSLSAPQLQSDVKKRVVELPAPKPAVPEKVVVAESVMPTAWCAHALLPPEGYSLEVLMLQLFLDRQNISAGTLDGVWGSATLEAMQAWQQANGNPVTRWATPQLYALYATQVTPVLDYTITAADEKLVTGPTPATWAERAELAVMGYATLAECLAEKFHTSVRTLQRMNDAIGDWDNSLHAGMTIRVPNVTLAPKVGSVAKIEINLSRCRMQAYDAAGKLLMWMPCSIARNRAHLPDVSTMSVVNMAPAPNYTYDPANYGQDASVGKMIVNAGPRNPVGSRWIGLSKAGYGIHGTPHPGTVGRTESRGCFRLANWNVEKLFEGVTTETQITLTEDSARDEL